MALSSTLQDKNQVDDTYKGRKTSKELTLPSIYKKSSDFRFHFCSLNCIENYLNLKKVYHFKNT